ncbi:S8/S53 family peptidase [Sphaerisporangium rubeum]|uniref:Subtilisin family serine protease n=2 Tax=Sphaerisporangium rubeum TaxID=321317 RepID=A0A7X0IGQ9_9ACTN|nr:S8/S53 family peptidase [Sphaerisporangium rubeum]MBB6473382.1 subtilisin family serine protease [Sphaerisporangium rubeum]
MAPDRFHEQLRFIAEAMGTTLVGGPPGEIPFYAYESGYLLIRAEEAGVVVDELNATGGRRGEPVRLPEVRPASGLLRVPVASPDTATTPDGGVVGALRDLERLHGRAGRQLASRNHLVTITPGGVNSCPADEPEATWEDFHPAVRAAPAAAGEDRPPVTVLVIDTGVVKDLHTMHPWMRGVVPPAPADEMDPRAAEHRTLPPVPGGPFVPGAGPLSPGGPLFPGVPGTGGSGLRPPPTHDPAGFVREYVGHGTFIAGLVQAVAPHTRVTVSNKMTPAGCVLEEEFAKRLLAALEPGWPDIISLSAGAANGLFTPLMGLEWFLDALKDHPGTLLVAAAGNNGSDAPFWPAAAARYPAENDGVVSVGALRVDGREGACFTDHGEWVRVYAPGERLVGAFLGADGPQPYRYQHSTFERCRYLASYDAPFLYDCTCGFPARVGALSESPQVADQAAFTGRAKWSGTSFSTPIVAAMIADHMVTTGERDPRAAAKDLMRLQAYGATVRGVPVRALRPSGWNPVPVTPLPHV